MTDWNRVLPDDTECINLVTDLNNKLLMIRVLVTDLNNVLLMIRVLVTDLNKALLRIRVD